MVRPSLAPLLRCVPRAARVAVVATVASGATATAAFAVRAPVVASAAAVKAPVGPITVPGRIVELAVAADGGLRAATITETNAGGERQSSAALSLIAPTGAVTGGAAASGADSSGTSIALTPDGGAMTAYAVPGTGPDRSLGSYVATRAIDATGQPGVEQDVSTPGQPANSPGDIAVGANGAVALTYLERDLSSADTIGSSGATPLQNVARDGVQVPRLAFRPAGATDFFASVPLDAPGRAATYRVLLGPHGGGVILATPNAGTAKGGTRIRRLAPDGTLGPWLGVAIGRHVDVTASAAWSGITLALAFRTVDQVRDEVRAKLYVTTLADAEPRPAAPGAAAAPATAGPKPTKPQRLSGASEGGDAATLDLVDLGRGRVALAADGKERTVQLFEGKPGRLKKTEAIRARGLALARLLPRPKGGLSLFWLGSASKATDVFAFAAHRAKGRKFGKRLTVRGYPAAPGAGSFSSDATSLAAPIVLPGNKAAFAYNPAGGDGKGTLPATVLTTR